ncbi:hypothetical protein [Criblamydia sequanensis]|uniref:Polyketide cyclase/dehydrase n=1 Tax=Candidatus Criblamydia sequanensis CRIB-18 TaxID=1437425 RepID=A0A090D207_9BACT|nr:hypothetical protein [Criblamydia sequanensis]CDR34215.1 hypothetical protein CSEC_1396 [Criblamydia sequanensis CRIB-18]
MFKWFYEYNLEVDLPLEELWSFCTNPSHWPKNIDEFESCMLEAPFQKGSTVKTKIKNKKGHVSIHILDVEPYRSYKTLTKIPFFSQESLTTFQKISKTRSKLTTKTCVKSILTPFFRSYYRKKIEKQYDSFSKIMIEMVNRT